MTGSLDATDMLGAVVHRRATLAGYSLVEQRVDGCAWQRGNVRVIASAAREDDERMWLHVSVSLPDRVPPYGLLVDVKDVLCGREAKAVQVFPPRSEHVNQHPYCLHLWCCLDGDPLPDFTRGGETL